jgi:DNA-binding PadR family transcriptional regulator
MPSDPQTLLPLTPAVFHILLALSDGERHGYAIMQEVAVLTEGALRLGPGTLYGTLKRLLAAGMVEEVADRRTPEAEDERRRYYRLTEAGRRIAQSEARRLEGLVNAARVKRLLPTGELPTGDTKGGL